MTDQRNLIIAIALSIAILLGFQVLFEGPKVRERQAEAARKAMETSEQAATAPQAGALPGAGSGVAAPPGATPAVPTLAPAEAQAEAAKNRAKLIAEQFAGGTRVKIATPALHGSLNLVGGRIDDLTLANYRETPDRASPEIVLLSPAGTADAYYGDFGWAGAAGGDQPLPNEKTRWALADGQTLTPSAPVTLRWDNGKGLIFERMIAVDPNFMFTVTQRVRNASAEPVRLLPWGLIARFGTPTTAGYYILHEGPLGVLDGSLTEEKYDAVKKAGTIAKDTVGGWIGITDKYWLVSLVPDQSAAEKARFLHGERGRQDFYQVDMMGATREVAPGAVAEDTTRMFAGAKQVRLLDAYAEALGIAKFDLAIDFGWFYFLTKPFFYGLDLLAGLVGNFGIAILLFTVLIKGAFYPLANKSYQAMSRMKKLQPDMQKLRERFGDDKARLNQEMMALYKREQVNPMAGCLPILVQIPVFFSLYKVLFVTIEMRQAPFFGWIHDLSVPDPTTIFNLFGVIPWNPPQFLHLGLWPLLMGVTMWLQQKMNPAPPDPVQQKVFQFLPIVFTFMLASFPAGLVIYWAWNNLLSIAQQWMIMRRMGVKPG